MDVETIRTICLTLPHTSEGIKWGHDLCFMIAGKMFCVVGLESPNHCSFKCSDEDFAELTERDHIIPAPYMARNKWVMVEKGECLSREEWEHYIKASYRLIFQKLPKKLQEKLK